jgi:hypothetical protein
MVIKRLKTDGRWEMRDGGITEIKEPNIKMEEGR